MAKVTLIDYPVNPLKTIAAQVLNMSGDMRHDLDTITEDEAVEALRQLQRTKLQGALEFGGDYVFQIDGVNRAFTHQTVRTRVGAGYSQESMRFTAKDGDQFKYDAGPSITSDSARKDLYDRIMSGIQDGYEKLGELGASTEDRRGVLPTNILTKIGVRFNLKTLMGIAEVRLCYQAQPHWRDIVQQMKDEIAKKVHPAIAGLLVRACDRSGRCEFRAVFDRPCPVQAELERRLCEGCVLQATCRNRGVECRAKERFM